MLVLVVASCVLAIAIGQNTNVRIKAARPTIGASRATAPAGAGELDQLCAPTAADSIEELGADEFQRFLGADEIVSRRYRTGSVSFDVYVALWRAGNSFAAEAALHPPDWCWPAAGWHCVNGQSGLVLSSGGRRLLPGESRRFVTAGGRQQFALYWCLVGNQPVVLAAAPSPHQTARVGWRGLFFESNFLRFWVSRLRARAPSPVGRPIITVPCPNDVWFVRINSSQPLPGIASSPAFIHLHPLLSAVGVLR